jgi:hypothetical protein
MKTTTIKRYLHGRQDGLCDLWKPEAKQQKNYHYALYEVAIDLEGDLDTGKSRILAVDGIDLVEPGEFQ